MGWIGIDVGGTKFAAGYFEEGNLLGTFHGASPTGCYGDFLNSVAAAIKYLGALGPIEGVGVAIAAWLSPDRQFVHRSANLGWDNKPLPADLEGRLAHRVVMFNDGDAAAWGGHIELGKPAESMIVLTLGTDVGGGVIVNGRPVTGSHGVAGELGHIVIRDNGHACVCGSRGCLATVASGPALLRDAKRLATESPDLYPLLLDHGRLHGDGITREDIGRAVTSPTEAALLLGLLSDAVAATSAVISRVIDHRYVYVAGGVSALGAPLKNLIEEALACTTSIGNVLPNPEVVMAKNSKLLGVFGAADLALIEISGGKS